MESGSAGPNQRIQYRCAGDKHRINDKVLFLLSSYPVKLNITKMAPPKFINYPSNKSIERVTFRDVYGSRVKI